MLLQQSRNYTVNIQVYMHHAAMQGFSEVRSLRQYSWVAATAAIYVTESNLVPWYIHNLCRLGVR